MPGGQNGGDTECLPTQPDESRMRTLVVWPLESVGHDSVGPRIVHPLLLVLRCTSITGRSSGFPGGRDHREGVVSGSMQSGFGRTLPQGPGPSGFLKKRSSTCTRRMVGSILA